MDNMNPEQFADLASSLNNFFTKINEQQQQPSYPQTPSNHSSATAPSKFPLQYFANEHYILVQLLYFKCNGFTSVYIELV